MVYSQVTSHVEKTHTVNSYGYTAGRASAHYILPISARPVGTHVRNDPVNWVDRWGLETLINEKGIIPGTETSYDISISGPDLQKNKVDTVTSVNTGAPTMPGYDQTTIINYNNGTTSGTVSSTVTNNPDKASVPPGFSPDASPIPGQTPTGGLGNDIILPEDVTRKDITSIEVTIKTEDGDEIKRNYEFNTPQENKTVGECNG